LPVSAYMHFASVQAFSQGPQRGVQFWYNDTSTVKSGGGGGVEKTFLWETFELYVTSCQYLFQARSKFFKHNLAL
jgi:hypothetical protein